MGYLTKFIIKLDEDFGKQLPASVAKMVGISKQYAGNCFSETFKEMLFKLTVDSETCELISLPEIYPLPQEGADKLPGKGRYAYVIHSDQVYYVDRKQRNKTPIKLSADKVEKLKEAFDIPKKLNDPHIVELSVFDLKRIKELTRHEHISDTTVFTFKVIKELLAIEGDDFGGDGRMQEVVAEKLKLKAESEELERIGQLHYGQWEKAYHARQEIIRRNERREMSQEDKAEVLRLDGLLDSYRKIGEDHTRRLKALDERTKKYGREYASIENRWSYQVALSRLLIQNSMQREFGVQPVFPVTSAIETSLSQCPSNVQQLLTACEQDDYFYHIPTATLLKWYFWVVHVKTQMNELINEFPNQEQRDRLVQKIKQAKNTTDLEVTENFFTDCDSLFKDINRGLQNFEHSLVSAMAHRLRVAGDNRDHRRDCDDAAEWVFCRLNVRFNVYEGWRKSIQDQMRYSLTDGLTAQLYCIVASAEETHQRVCSLYSMRQFPDPTQVEQYKGHYILITQPHDQLFYIAVNGRSEPINNFASIKSVIPQSGHKIDLTRDQVSQLVTSNKGHNPQLSLVSQVDLFSEKMPGAIEIEHPFIKPKGDQLVAEPIGTWVPKVVSVYVKPGEPVRALYNDHHHWEFAQQNFGTRLLDYNNVIAAFASERNRFQGFAELSPLVNTALMTVSTDRLGAASSAAAGAAEALDKTLRTDHPICYWYQAKNYLDKQQEAVNLARKQWKRPNRGDDLFLDNWEAIIQERQKWLVQQADSFVQLFITKSIAALDGSTTASVDHESLQAYLQFIADSAALARQLNEEVSRKSLLAKRETFKGKIDFIAHFITDIVDTKYSKQADFEGLEGAFYKRVSGRDSNGSDINEAYFEKLQKRVFDFLRLDPDRRQLKDKYERWFELIADLLEGKEQIAVWEKGWTVYSDNGFSRADFAQVLNNLVGEHGLSGFFDCKLNSNSAKQDPYGDYLVSRIAEILARQPRHRRTLAAFTLISADTDHKISSLAAEWEQEATDLLEKVMNGISAFLGQATTEADGARIDRAIEKLFKEHLPVIFSVPKTRATFLRDMAEYVQNCSETSKVDLFCSMVWGHVNSYLGLASDGQPVDELISQRLRVLKDQESAESDQIGAELAETIADLSVTNLIGVNGATGLIDKLLSMKPADSEFDGCLREMGDSVNSVLASKNKAYSLLDWLDEKAKTIRYLKRDEVGTQQSHQFFVILGQVRRMAATKVLGERFHSRLGAIMRRAIHPHDDSYPSAEPTLRLKLREGTDFKQKTPSIAQMPSMAQTARLHSVHEALVTLVGKDNSQVYGIMHLRDNPDALREKDFLAVIEGIQSQFLLVQGLLAQEGDAAQKEKSLLIQIKNAFAETVVVYLDKFERYLKELRQHWFELEKVISQRSDLKEHLETVKEKYNRYIKTYAEMLNSSQEFLAKSTQSYADTTTSHYLNKLTEKRDLFKAFKAIVDSAEGVDDVSGEIENELRWLYDLAQRQVQYTSS